MTVILPRIVQVSVGLAGAVGRQWDQRMYIKGEIKRSSGSTPNKAKIEIYNLAPASLVLLEQPKLVMQVAVGEGVPGTIFYGEIDKSGVRTKISHPNQITTIKATDGRRTMQEAYFAGSYPAGTTRTQIRTDALAANAVPLGYVAPLPERVYQAPVAFGGRLQDVLDELYLGEPAGWSLQAGAFTLLLDDVPGPGNALIVSAATGMIGSPERTDKGAKVSTSQIGAIAPGRPFVIASRVVNGQYKATSVTDKFDTELEWQSNLVGTVIK